MALSGGTYYDGNPHLMAGLARDRTDGLLGLITLGLGFLVQMLGYVLTLAYEPTDAQSWGHAAIALLLAVLVGGMTWRVVSRLSDRLTKRTLMAVASLRIIKRGDEPPEHVTHPFATKLLALGKASNWPARPGEDAESYAQRVFNVERFTPEPPPD